MDYQYLPTTKKLFFSSLPDPLFRNQSLTLAWQNPALWNKQCSPLDSACYIHTLYPCSLHLSPVLYVPTVLRFALRGIWTPDPSILWSEWTLSCALLTPPLCALHTPDHYTLYVNMLLAFAFCVTHSWYLHYLCYIHLTCIRNIHLRMF